MEQVFQFLFELVPYAGVSAILYEAPYIVGERFAGEHHRSGGSHGNAMHYGTDGVAEDTRGDINPLHYVFPVEPAHLDGIAFGQSRIS